MKVKILGTEYTILRKQREEDDYFKSDEYALGYCDDTVKEIVILKPEDSPANLKDMKKFENETIRHEVIHAFLSESGLKHSSGWAKNEEIIDYFAIQFLKIYEVIQQITNDSNKKEDMKMK